mgnify:CR=1 FL=1
MLGVFDCAYNNPGTRFSILTWPKPLHPATTCLVISSIYVLTCSIWKMVNHASFGLRLNTFLSYMNKKSYALRDTCSIKLLFILNCRLQRLLLGRNIDWSLSFENLIPVSIQEGIWYVLCSSEHVKWLWMWLELLCDHMRLIMVKSVWLFHNGILMH